MCFNRRFPYCMRSAVPMNRKKKLQQIKTIALLVH